MPLRNRNELKSFFQVKSHLSSAHFAELIESMLNKREDQFHGIWKAGQTYRHGDVVIYQGSLWEMTAEGEISSKDNKLPSKKNKDWKSVATKDANQAELKALRNELNLFKQETDERLKQLEERLNPLC